jgi:hypothetical protein
MDSKQRSNPDSLWLRGAKCSVWSDESFDHVIRHGAELEGEYIRQNPVKRALVEHPDSYEWLFIKSITG